MSSLLLVVIVVVVFPATFDFLIFYVSSFYQTFLKIVFPLAIALFVFSVEAGIECFKCFPINGKTTSTANGVFFLFFFFQWKQVSGVSNVSPSTAASRLAATPSTPPRETTTSSSAARPGPTGWESSLPSTAPRSWELTVSAQLHSRRY